MLAPTPASPESVGMSRPALDRLENHLKQRYVDAGRFPAPSFWSIAAARSCTRPCRALPISSARSPVKDDTIFRIYSMTKPITSVAFMMLVEEGRVALDEPVHKYIPEWKNLGVFQAGLRPS